MDFNAISRRTAATNLDWRGHILREVKAHLSPPEAVRVGDRLYRVGDNPTFVINQVEDDVLRALIELGRAADLSTLRQQLECDAPHKVLRQICRNYPALAPSILFPPEGKKGRGGYRTTVKMAEK